MTHGGKREKAGRPKGGKNKATLERKAVSEAFNQRAMAKADALFNAQLTLAVGSMKVFRIEEEKDGNKVKRTHVHVTDADEIKALLDEHDGGNGVVDGVYYYFAAILPDNRAIDSILNRALGKPVETVAHTVELVGADAARLAAEEFVAKHPSAKLKDVLPIYAEKFNVPVEQISDAVN